MSNGPITREEAAERLATIVGQFVRDQGHNMPDAEIRAFADAIRDGNDKTYYTMDSPTLSYVEYVAAPDGPEYRSVYAFSRDNTGHSYDDELDALLPIELIAAILDPAISKIRATMLALATWYRESTGGPLPDPVLTHLPRALRKNLPFAWNEHGFTYSLGAPDVNGYIIRILERESRRNDEIGFHTVNVICRELSLKATARFVELMGNAPQAYYVEPIDPAGAIDLAELVAAIIKWWYPQDFTYVPYPEAEHAQFVEAMRRGEQAVLMIASHIIENYRIVVGPPDSNGTIVRVEVGFGTGQWKPVLYATECVGLALEQTVGTDALRSLFTPA
ncbi:MAG: hypothetical protein RI947_1255 [Candidatus Parcubacteria bacterium]|jgi:hypothetical protein